MFNYFLHSIVLIFLGYSSIYPILFWITPLTKIETSFYRFNLGKCCVVGSLGALAYHFISTNIFTETIVWLWLFLLISATAFYWNKNKIHNTIVSLISILGIFALLNILSYFVNRDLLLSSSFSVGIGSLITAGVFFSMILGHWYLNVIALPISLLRNSVITLSMALALRTIWDIFYLSTNQYTDAYGIAKNSWSFLFDFDGLLLLVAIFMGNIFPILINYFVWKTLDVQATQSATGLIYVSIISVLFGDIIFKYYLLQYGIPL
tara:strand:+ start:925 stop:1716 length:792 start_codon:yes stop_codon:yes gene_type:complete